MSDDFTLPDDPGTGTGLVSSPVTPGALLEALNDEQRRAVETTDGPLLVLSGAGTGKTRVLTTRLAYILASGRAQPWRMLAVTFTNRAAREMRERLATMIGPASESLWLGTFHAIGVRILRRHAELVGLKSNFTILDTDDQLRLLKQIMEAEGIDTRKSPPPALMGILQRWKDRGLTPDKVRDESSGERHRREALALFAPYQRRLLAVNAADFGDLLLHNLTLFQNHPDVLAQYQDQFRYILVDEYQDTNVSQYLWLRLLTQRHKNLCCVGDDDQSIYSWRGAEVGNILRFEQDFPGAQVIRLESNYRSSASILAAASGLIRHNKGRLGKDLRAAALDDPGDKVSLRGVWDGEEEARVVVEEIEAEQRQGRSLGEMAILVRAGFQTREFEERFIITGVPYRVVGGPRFYERQEIRDAIAYLRVILQPDDDLALVRILNVPKRGLGDSTLQTLHLVARGQGVTLMEAARRLVETDELRPTARVALRALIADFDRWRDQVDRKGARELTALMLDESGYMAMWLADRSPDAPGRIENLKEMVAALEEYENLAGFLEHVSLVMENDQRNDHDRVTVMTLHAAKGLEFDVVFLPGWEEGLFPHQRALEEGGDRALEEERRLAYVGITRARRRVFVSFAANRRVYGRWQTAIQSRFISELPPGAVRQATAPGVPGGRRGFGEYRYDWKASGWREGGGNAPVIDVPARQVVTQASFSPYPVGDRVFHQKFGYGVVRDVDGEKLSILFDKTGMKKVMTRFVQKG
ncbi:MAG: UvrD-helicase domain-containing protein [Alphaproteobacteria bacterium]|nr:UvrD-helicase domain-containing protein [Alphaproteobacteria bacterium]